MQPPPDPRAFIDQRHPPRRFDVTLESLIGWPAERVSSTLGEPDSRARPRLWPPPDDARDPRDGLRFTGCLSVTDDGEILNVHPFGMRPQKIQLGVPYEEWRYENVQGATWVIYLTPDGATAPSNPIPWEALAAWPAQLPPSWWRRLLGWPAKEQPRNAMSVGRRIPPAFLRVDGPLAVAEVAIYPTGAVF